ncbi:MAG: protein phosphatase 2C domain-containing protein [Coprothermobacterota bacterium]|nr:protein phosphatase 2C domain-containing protein [Coprothermobacterota bacterium]
MGLSDRGHHRPANEDAFFLSAQRGLTDDLSFFLVADGLGGLAGGTEASCLAVETVSTFLLDSNLPPAERLQESFRLGHQAILAGQQSSPSLFEMATTLTALLLSGNLAWVGNVGDSRTYLLRQGAIRQISLDHSWVAEQVRAGFLSEQAARRHPYRNVVTRILGGLDEPQADIFPLVLQAADRFMLASDGLFTELPDSTLGSLAASPDLTHAAEELLQAALHRGGHDNITLILIECLEVDPL